MEDSFLTGNSYRIHYTLIFDILGPIKIKSRKKKSFEDSFNYT